MFKNHPTLDEQAAALPEDVRTRRIRLAEKALEGYGNYENYETFVVDVFIANDGGATGDYRTWTDYAKSVIRDHGRLIHTTDDETRKRNIIFAIADELKSVYEIRLEKAQAKVPNPFKGLMRAGFDSVNWEEVAEELYKAVTNK